MTNADLIALVDRLRVLPSETEWQEFKRNNPDPIGARRSNSSRNQALWALLDVVACRFFYKGFSKGLNNGVRAELAPGGPGRSWI